MGAEFFYADGQTNGKIWRIIYFVTEVSRKHLNRATGSQKGLVLQLGGSEKGRQFPPQNKSKLSSITYIQHCILLPSVFRFHKKIRKFFTRRKNLRFLKRFCFAKFLPNKYRHKTKPKTQWGTQTRNFLSCYLCKTLTIPENLEGQ